MADFKKALKAVIGGKLEEKKFSSRMDMLLRQSPKATTVVLEELEKARTSYNMQADMYTRLRDKAERVAEETGVLKASDLKKRGIAQDKAPEPEIEVPGVSDGTVDFALDEAGDNREPTATKAASTGWTEASSKEETESDQLDIGSVIKHRFKLLEVLGEGGMGKVFKGIDLLKQEARDRNPYVAIKLLNEDFKQHPEAFISLQRESSRQQKLAHPNIATVYDFDRIGTSGSQVYLTMELLEGVALNDFIREKTRPIGGLSFEKAFPMIRGLGEALSYAHEQNIVHSDFKPGNSFFCKDGNMKVLDFGIARAAKNPITGDSEKTLFDPGKLGALTPAYASLEMLEGEEPDPRDDIYALGCVSYELLTGKHPFGKMPATVARENKLSPPSIKGLKAKQNRALKHSVAFHRKDRSPSVSSFVEELEGKANWHKNPLFLASTAIVLLAGIAFFPVKEYLHQEKIQKTILQMQDNQDYVGEMLGRLDSYSEQDRKLIIEETRKPIQQYYESKVNYVIQTEEGRYNFTRANELLGEVHILYPDSRWLEAFMMRVQTRKDQLLYELNKRYLQLLESPDGLLTSQEQINKVLDQIGLVSPSHHLLKDQRRVNAYWEVAKGELEKGRYPIALHSVNSGLEIAPDDRRLLNLKGKIEREQRIALLEAEVNRTLPGLKKLEDYLGIEQKITELVALAPGSEAVTLLALQTKDVLQEKVADIRASGSRVDAESTVKTYGKLLSALQFGRALSELKLLHLTGTKRQQVIQEILGESQEGIERLLKNPMLGNPDWQNGLRAALQQLAALLPVNDPFLPETHKRIASLHIVAADRLLQQQRYEEAINMLESAIQLAPSVNVLKEKEQEILTAQNEFQRKKEEEQRLARLESDKETMQVALKAQTPDSMAAARKILGQLQQALPPGDPYLTDQAPALFEATYLSLSKARADQKQFAEALKFLQVGLEVVPDSTRLKQLEREYRVEKADLELKKVFREDFDFSSESIAKTRSFLEQEAPSRYARLLAESVEVLTKRIQGLAEQKPEQARALAEQALKVFPDQVSLRELRDSFNVIPWENQDEAKQALRDGQLSQAQKLLEQAPKSHPDFNPFQERLEKQIEQATLASNEFQKLLGQAGDDQAKLRAAQSKLQRARQIWKDNQKFQLEWVELDDKLRRLQAAPRQSRIRRQEADLFEEAPPSPAPRPRAAPVENPASTTAPTPAAPAREQVTRQQSNEQQASEPTANEQQASEPQANVAPAPTPSPATNVKAWQPLSSPAECTTKLAGYGRRIRAVCYDMISSQHRGPDLVVVPAGGNLEKPFAIGKYEISQHDYNKYCFFSKKCKPIPSSQKDKNAPLTNLSIKFINEYLAWLSQRTNKNYRLPTSSEWEYAAQANASSMTASQISAVRRNLNCQVVQNNQILKGLAPLSVRSGTANGWGLNNYLGNVQELVSDSGVLAARGGSHKDSLQDCQIDLRRAHDGAPSLVTGFRVVREEIY